MRTNYIKKLILTTIILISIITIFIAYFNSKTVVTATISHSERVNYRNGGKYLIFTSNETFQDTDNIFYWKWNSSDLYGKLKKGKTYKFTVVGWRIPFISAYRNILSVRKLNPDLK